MKNSYKLFSWTYRIILGFLTTLYLVISLIFSGNIQENDNSDFWIFLYSALTISIITAFHSLDNNYKYKRFVQILSCTSVLISLGILSFFIFDVIKNGDSNLLVTAVLFIATVVNLVFLFYIIQDKKYNYNA